MTIYLPALAGLGEFNPFTSDWRSFGSGGSSTPIPTPTVKASGGNVLDKMLTFADGAIDFVDRNATKAVNVLEKVGQMKGKTKAAKYQVDDAYRRNVTQTPRYVGEDWFPGIPNIAVLIIGGVFLTGTVLLMRRSNP